MKQPVNGLSVFKDEGEDWMPEPSSYWIDLLCGGTEGGMCNVGISRATTEAAAWRKAVRRLERLLKEAKKKAGME